MIGGREIIEKLRDEARQRRDDAHAEMAKAQRKIEHAEIEVAAYEKALAAMGGEAPKTERTHPKVSDIIKRAVDLENDAPTTPAPFSEKWVAVFRDMFNNANQPYTYDDVSSAAARMGSTSGMNSLRAQMMKAVDGGLFERIEAGKFRITEFGLETIGVSQKENGPPKGDPEAEEVDASSKLSRQERTRDLLG